MADESNNGARKPLIMSLAEVKEKHRKVSREELDNDLTALSFAIYGKQEKTELQLAELAKIVKQQNQSIITIAAALNRALARDEATLAGRIRRARAHLALWWDGFRGEARAIADHVDPPRPDLDNPEAMPKP